VEARSKRENSHYSVVFILDRWHLAAGFGGERFGQRAGKSAKIL
jgi:hypothetical protein